MATPPPASALQALSLFGLLMSSNAFSTPAYAATITTGPLTSCVELLPVSGQATAFGVVHTCGPRRRVKMWGDNNSGQLGREDNVILGSLTGVPVNGATMKFIKGAGDKHVLTGCGGLSLTCVLLGDAADATSGDVKCFGGNSYGQLGIDRATQSLGSSPGDLDTAPVIDLNGEKVTALSCGTATVCALTTAEEIKCWGHNGFGEAGVDSKEMYKNEMGADLKAVKLPGIQFNLLSSSEIVCGSGPNGTFCWGYEGSGAYGNPGLSPLHLGGVPGSMATLAANPIDLGLSSDEYVKELSATGTDVCVLVGSTAHARGRVKCWGQNSNGELATGDVNPRGSHASEMGANLQFVDYGSSNKSAVKITMAVDHNCVLFSDGAAACFGYNANGALGVDSEDFLGSTPDTVGEGTQFVKMAGRRIWDIAAAFQTTVVIAGEYREIFAFGTNNQGQLGIQGELRALGREPGDMASLVPIEPGFCSVANFLEIPDLSAEWNFTESYYVYNPLPSTAVYARVQADSARVTSPDFDRTVEIGPGARHRFGTVFAEGESSAPVTISGVYWCKHDEEVQAALPALTVSPPTAAPTTAAPTSAPEEADGTAPPALGNGTAPPTSSAVEVTFRLWGVVLTAVVAFLFW